MWCCDIPERMIIHFLSKLLIFLISLLFLSEKNNNINAIIFKRMLTIFGNILNPQACDNDILGALLLIFPQNFCTLL